MIRTYERTMMIEDLTKATIKIYLYEGCKYTAKSIEDLGEEKEVTYTGVTSWDIIKGDSEAKKIESMTDESSVDEFHEYLVLHFEDGSEATFRNSHVEMFII